MTGRLLSRAQELASSSSSSGSFRTFFLGGPWLLSCTWFLLISPCASRGFFICPLLCFKQHFREDSEVSFLGRGSKEKVEGQEVRRKSRGEIGANWRNILWTRSLFARRLAGRSAVIAGSVTAPIAGVGEGAGVLWSTLFPVEEWADLLRVSVLYGAWVGNEWVGGGDWGRWKREHIGVVFSDV